MVGHTGTDGLDHRLPDNRLAVRFTHVLYSAPHHFGFFRVTRVPFATGDERSTMKFLHRNSPFDILVPGNVQHRLDRERSVTHFTIIERRTLLGRPARLAFSRLA